MDMDFFFERGEGNDGEGEYDGIFPGGVRGRGGGRSRGGGRGRGSGRGRGGSGDRGGRNRGRAGGMYRGGSGGRGGGGYRGGSSERGVGGYRGGSSERGGGGYRGGNAYQGGGYPGGSEDRGAVGYRGGTGYQRGGFHNSYSADPNTGRHHPSEEGGAATGQYYRGTGGDDRGGRSYRGGPNGDRNLGRQDGGNERMHPAGWAALNSYKDKSPEEILCAFSNQRTGLLAVFKQSTNTLPPIRYNERIDLVLVLLRRALSHESSDSTLSELLSTLNQGEFSTTMTTRISRMLGEVNEPAFSWKPLRDFADIATIAFERLPPIKDKLLPCVMTAKTLVTLNPVENKDIIQKLTTLESSMIKAMGDTAKKEKAEAKPTWSRYTADGPPPDDFRQIDIFPSSEEIHSKKPAFLRENRVQGKGQKKTAYDNLDEYLDTQFRLLREDFLYPLRTGIHNHIKQVNGRSDDRARNTDVRVYRSVKILTATKTEEGLAHSIQVDVVKQRVGNWSKRLIYGSFVGLSHNNFETILFACVANRDEEGLQTGRLEIRFEGNSLADAQNAEIFTRDYVMVETTAYFESYRPVLQSLQRIKKLPFEKNIVLAQREMTMPEYVTTKTTYDLSGVISQSPASLPSRMRLLGLRGHTVNLASRRWPPAEALGLDQSQYEAFKVGLTHQLSIIQGPPGTGKTYIGLKIARTLHDNKDVWFKPHMDPVVEPKKGRKAYYDLDGSLIYKSDESDGYSDDDDLYGSSHRSSRHNVGEVKVEEDVSQPKSSPILVVCYTNHALDQFLEGILEFCAEGIVRIGSRSKSTKLKPFNLSELRRKNEYFSKTIHHAVSTARDELRRFREKTVGVSKRALNARSGLLRTERILAYMGPKHAQQLSSALPLNTMAALGMYTSYADLSLQVWLQTSDEFSEDLRDVPAPLMGVNNPFRKPTAREKQMKHRFITHLPSGASWNVTDGGQLNMGQHNRLPHQHMPMGDYGHLPDEFQMDGEDFFEAEEMWEGENEDFATVTDVFDRRNDDSNPHLLKELYGTGDGDHHVNDLIEDLQYKADFEKRTKQPKKDAQGFQTVAKKRSSEFKRILNQIQNGISMSDGEAERVKDVWALPLAERWQLYRRWLAQFSASLQSEAGAEFEEYNKLCKRLTELRQMKDLAVIKAATFVGMTTTRAANYWGLLQSVKPRIVIVEEAAEVLEAHIITTLSNGCEHLILIGDHQQLRPSPSVYRLATDYNLEISLFERMFRNKVPHCSLQVQHRMRPEIAAFMREIYDKIDDHDDVQHYPSVQGVRGNMWFISHKRPEEKNNELMSHSNQHEAELSLALCRYLLLQGYDTSQITILTMYSGQLMLFKKLMKGERVFQDLQVTSVDNFQGEENIVIILSLVRSNPEGKTGFISVDNRVCVALSRAKHGLYVLGNFEMILKDDRCELWRNIIAKAKDQGQYGTELPLVCKTHNTVTPVSALIDFKKVENGGCNDFCRARLKCGHTCPQQCHNDDVAHLKYICGRVCEKKLLCGHECKRKCNENCGSCTTPVMRPLTKCGHIQKMECGADEKKHYCKLPCEKDLPCAHQCKNKCGQNCETTCSEIVKSRLLPCMHKADLPCHQDPSTHQCQQPVARRLPCTHVFSAPCHDDSLKKQKCKEKCRERLACGHTCSGDCSTCQMSGLHKSCTQKCDRKLPCGHVCPVPCMTECPPCEKMCETSCDHSKCRLKCGEPCKPCKERCKWKCMHHECTMQCHEICNRRPCDQRCTKATRCKKKSCKESLDCIAMCGEPCIHLCQKCDESKIKDIYGDESGEGATSQTLSRQPLVLLPDCGHYCRVTTMDMRFKVRVDDQVLPACPRCQTPIVTCRRYRMFTSDAAASRESAKQRAYGSQYKRGLLRSSLAIFKKKENGRDAMVTFFELNTRVNAAINDDTTSKPHLEVLIFQMEYLSILKGILKMRYLADSVDEAASSLREDLSSLERFVKRPRKVILPNEEADVRREITRLNLLAILLVMKTYLHRHASTSACERVVKYMDILVSSSPRLTVQKLVEVGEIVQKMTDAGYAGRHRVPRYALSESLYQTTPELDPHSRGVNDVV